MKMRQRASAGASQTKGRNPRENLLPYPTLARIQRDLSGVPGRRLWMAVSRECETRRFVEEPAPHLPAQLHDKGAGK